MFSQLSTDTSLYILSFLPLPDVAKLYTLSRNIRHFLEQNETSIYHRLAVLHQFVSPGLSLDGVVEGERIRGDSLDGIRTWKDLCRRCAANEHNWSGRGSVVEGGYLPYSSDVCTFRVDETERTVLAITATTPKRTLSVRALEDGRLLWSLPAVNALDLSDGFLLLSRNNGGIEIWKRANDVVRAASSLASPLRAPSPLAATAAQLKQSPSALDASNPPRDLRGVYVPHGFLPSFTGVPFRITRLKAPWLAAVDLEAPHVVRLYDVAQGTLVRCLDFDAIIRANTAGQQPADFVLFDLDISGTHICACFESALVVVPLRSDDAPGGSAARKTRALVYMEDQGPFDVRQKAYQLSKRGANLDFSVPGGTIHTYKDLSALKVSGTDALEVHAVVPPSEETAEEISQALVRPGAHRSAGFISARFSPDGQHLLAGTVYSLLYLLRDVAGLLNGTVRADDAVQKLHIGEPVRDLVWDAHAHRAAIRTEPGDTFIVDLCPGYHLDVRVPADAPPALAGARLLRLRDFASLYGGVTGNLLVRRSGVWFVWDVAQMHEDVRTRVREQGKSLTYADGRPVRQNDVNEKAVSVCFVDFTDRF
ncbi:hypothetical protein PsYK624_164600 [Phanerochaete sordida]|uniref:F-box domain-containing protein n=1 Tax=Phanerochaete sordida TaxID=48140 RepID=A0A9P3LM93_9APHY|nr:hypothetical protein PsYK624_164600 [Phanerochaete sordida]